MAGGGTWETQNKVRPGIYIRFRSGDGTGLTVGNRGTVAICEPMSWGPVGKVMTVEAGADTTPYCGYALTQPGAKFLQQIFLGTNRTAGASKVYLFRPSADSSASATATVEPLTATAKYPGARGNDISIVITEDADTSGVFTVNTVVDGQIADSQTGKTAGDLAENDWVVFSGTGALTATTGAPLTGGADGTVQAAAYSAFLANIEPYKFDILIYDGTESTVQAAMISFVKRIAEENGQYAQLVAPGLKNPDSRYVINVKSGAALDDGTVLTAAQVCWWVGGAEAGAMYNESLTNAVYPNAVTASPVNTNNEIIAALNAGEFVLTADNGTVRVEQDINSLITYTADIGKVYRKNRVMRLCNTIANDVYAQFTQNYLGIVNNNEAGRALFKSAIVGYMLELQDAEAIQNFSADDVEILAGSDIDSVLINLAVHAVDSTEKVYMTITVS